MKKQIITLIIGILIGAILTAAVFLIVKPKNTRGVPDFSQFNKDGQIVKPDGENFDFSKMGKGRRNQDSTEEEKSTIDENRTEDTPNEKQG